MNKDPKETLNKNGNTIPAKEVELLDKKIIKKFLNSTNLTFADKIIVLKETTSTNDYLIKNIKNGIEICFAEKQTAGKGQLGRKWVSPFGTNIYLSIKKPIKQYQELNGISLAVAIATVEALKEYGIQKGISLKWPNDIIWEKQKLGGILIELSNKNIVVGIGLNVNMPPNFTAGINQAWCDILQITKSKPKRSELAGILLNQILTSLFEFQHNGLKPLLKKWHNLDVSYNKKITLITPQGKIQGIGKGINEKGNLLIQNAQGEIESFVSGEVSLKI